MPGGTHPTAEVILSWPMRSSNPERRGWTLTVGTTLLWVVTMVIVIARLWARFIVQRNQGADDMFIMVAMIPLTGLAIGIAGAGRWWYFDRHVWDLSPSQGVVSRKLVMANYCTYVLATSLTKISILLFYRRLSKGSISPVFHWTVRICIACVIAYAVTFEIVLFLGCRPINAFWNQVHISWLAKHVKGKDYSCFNEFADLLAATCVSMIQDFITCLLPCILFWKLQLPLKQKLALAVVFFLGIFTCVCATFRVFYIYHIFHQTYDVTWATYDAWIWTSLEAHLGVICASLPALKVFFKRYFNVSQINTSITSWHGTSKNIIGRSKKTSVKSKESGFFESDTTRINSISQTSKPAQASEDDVELGGIALRKDW